jgi:hypothetical protein
MERDEPISLSVGQGQWRDSCLTWVSSFCSEGRIVVRKVLRHGFTFGVLMCGEQRGRGRMSRKRGDGWKRMEASTHG